MTLFWHGRDDPSNIGFDQGLRTVFQSVPAGTLEFYVEYLETERFPGESQSQLLHDYLRRKYADREIDVVIAATDIALNFLLKHRDDLFHDAPIVYFTYQRPELPELPGKNAHDAAPGLTGVVVANTYKSTLDVALRLHPETKQVFIVIGGTTGRDKYIETVAREELKDFEGRVALTYLTSLPTAELIARMKSAPERSIILLVRHSEHGPGKSLSPIQGLELIAQSANVPIYGIVNTYLGHGIVGGYVINHEVIGAQVGEIVLRVAGGARPHDIPVENATLSPVFDWRQLRRWGISKDKLPAGSTVRFEELSLWDQHKKRIIAVLALIAVQTLLIAFLLLERERRQRTTGELRKSEEQFRLLFENSRDAILITDDYGNYLRVNQAACELLGFSCDQLLSMKVADLLSADAPLTASRFRSYLKTGFEAGEWSYVRPDGKYHTTLYTTCRFAPGLHLTILRDITERKQAEEELNQLNAELEQRIDERTAELAAKTHELETFAYSVAHDLKAPLRGIDGFSRLLLKRYADHFDEVGRSFLYNVRAATQQMNQLIDDLLAYSQLERRSLISGPTDLPALIRSVVGEKAHELRERNTELIVDIECGEVMADAAGLAQALRNLIDNSIKFTRDVEWPRIEIGAKDKGDSCQIWVRDNGVGFDMQFQDRIFEIFQRLHRMEDYTGTGVGLALVRKAMKRMGGRVWAESVPGKGSTFYLELPHATVTEKIVPARSEELPNILPR